jgi:hypothetical protein
MKAPGHGSVCLSPNQLKQSIVQNSMATITPQVSKPRPRKSSAHLTELPGHRSAISRSVAAHPIKVQPLIKVRIDG